MNRTLVIDIEAVAIDDCEQYLDLPEPPAPPDLAAIAPAANLVDPAKIASDIDKRREAARKAYVEAVHAHAEKRLNAIARCAIDPDLARIVVIGIMDGDHVSVAVSKGEGDEADELRWLWNNYDDHRLVTFNGFGYDLPLLMRRSLYLGVKCPTLNLDRYRSPHIDLMQKLSFNGAIKAHSLRFYAKRLGITTEDEVSGGDIGGLVAKGEWEKVRAHCESDVRITAEIAKRLGYLTSSVPVPEATGAF